MNYEFKRNILIDTVLYNDTENKIKSYIYYSKMLFNLKRSTPSYDNLIEIYDVILFLNFAYFHCLTDEDHLFIAESRKGKSNIQDKSLIYKDDTVKILLKLKPGNMITLHIDRVMGYPNTSITFEDGNAVINDIIEQQLFINCTNMIMNELYRMIKKYRRFGRSII